MSLERTISVPNGCQFECPPGWSITGAWRSDEGFWLILRPTSTVYLPIVPFKEGKFPPPNSWAWR